MKRLPARVTVVITLACALLAPARPIAVAGSSPIEQRAERLVRDVLATSPAQGTIPGIVIARGNNRLAARNPARAFRPASLQKLAITSAALMRFGPEHRFTTRVLATGQSVIDGSVGHLALVGGGDPTLSTKAFRTRYFIRRKGMASDERMFSSGPPTVGDLAARIDAAGVTRVRGNLIADDFLFDQKRTQEGWKSSYLDRSTGGPHVGLISALIVNQGYTNLDQTAITKNPPVYAAQRLRDALADRGIVVEGSIVHRRAPDGATEIARSHSPPLSEIVGWVNRWSANHPAELLLKGMGARFAGEGTTSGGARAVRWALRTMGVSTDYLRIYDGSGLSLSDRMTPKTMAGILRWAHTGATAAARAMRASLPIACRAGTLLRRMCDTRAEGNLRGKTGLVDRTRGMAGWARGSDGVWTIYVAIFNKASSPSALTSTLDLLGTRLARFR